MRPATGFEDYAAARRRFEQAFGDDAPMEPPRARDPRGQVRGVSRRWLGGVLLTGVGSVFLMGSALYSANDSRTTFAAVPQFVFAAKTSASVDGAPKKEDRLVVRAALRPVAKQLMDVEASTQIGERVYIAVRPFLRLSTPLALTRSDLTRDLSAFNPQSAFMQAGAKPQPKANTEAADLTGPEPTDSDLIETAALIMSPLDDASLEDLLAAEAVDERQTRPDDGFTQELRRIAAFENSQTVSPSALAYASLPSAPVGFDSGLDALDQFGPTDLDAYASLVRPGVAENVTTLPKTGDIHDVLRDTVPQIVGVAAGQTLNGVLRQNGVGAVEASLAQRALDLATREGDTVEIGVDIDGALRQVGLFRAGAHLGTVVATPSGAFLRVGEPDDVELAAPQRGQGSNTQIYASLFETTLKHGLPREMADKLVGIFNFDVNFRSAVQPGDALNVFYEVDPITQEPEQIVHAELSVGGETHRYYRFRLEDGSYGYFNEDGRSARKFLTRKPIARGKFRSPFGWRRHPVLRYSRMHNGVDYSAPRGTPIYAAGDGVVTRRQWTGGYGNHVEIRHANGYETTYSHMTRYAAGLQNGSRVRQGQIIGYVGSTGLSTGPHLHYEVHVNGRPVDPMRIKVPRTVEMGGEQLAAFQKERARIDALMAPDSSVNIAAR